MVNPPDVSRIQSCLIHVDVNKIAQVIRNLVSNGLKFTPHGGSVVVQVGVRGNEGDEGGDRNVDTPLIEVRVSDTGAGISQVSGVIDAYPHLCRWLIITILYFNPN